MPANHHCFVYVLDNLYRRVREEERRNSERNARISAALGFHETPRPRRVEPLTAAEQEAKVLCADIAEDAPAAFELSEDYLAEVLRVEALVGDYRTNEGRTNVRARLIGRTLRAIAFLLGDKEQSPRDRRIFAKKVLAETAGEATHLLPPEEITLALYALHLLYSAV